MENCPAGREWRGSFFLLLILLLYAILFVVKKREWLIALIINTVRTTALGRPNRFDSRIRTVEGDRPYKTCISAISHSQKKAVSIYCFYRDSLCFEVSFFGKTGRKTENCFRIEAFAKSIFYFKINFLFFI